MGVTENQKGLHLYHERKSHAVHEIQVYEDRVLLLK